MDEDAFWQLVDHIDRGSLTKDEDEAVEPLISSLSALEPHDIRAFEEQLAQRLYVEAIPISATFRSCRCEVDHMKTIRISEDRAGSKRGANRSSSPSSRPPRSSHAAGR